MIVSYEQSEEHRTDTLTSKTPSGFSLSTPSPFSSGALPSGAREPSCGQTPQQTLIIAAISSAERRSRLSGQICNKKDLESCNGPSGYSVSVSNWLSQKPYIHKECSLNSQYDISYLVLQSFKWWLEWRVIIPVVFTKGHPKLWNYRRCSIATQVVFLLSPGCTCLESAKNSYEKTTKNKNKEISSC